MVQNKGKRHSDHPFDLLNTVSGFLDLTEPAPPSTRGSHVRRGLEVHFRATSRAQVTARNEPSTDIERVAGYVGGDG